MHAVTHDKKKGGEKVKTLNISLLLLVVISLISTGVVSATTNEDTKSTVAAEGQIGKDAVIEPAATIDGVTATYYYAYAANYYSGYWRDLTSYSYSTGVWCGAGPGSYLACGTR